MCGGTAGNLSSNPAVAGLSPRVRGNLTLEAGAARRWGSIPACAGEPLPCEIALQKRSVYPRVCGGTLHFYVDNGAVWGLSPRVRGNHQSGDAAGESGGSIPACAGEPRADYGWRRTGRVYPRVCGGTCPDSIRYELALGLSPRVRGNRITVDDKPPPDGSIPACAGEPGSAPGYPAQPVVYPRVCGGTQPFHPLVGAG